METVDEVLVGIIPLAVLVVIVDEAVAFDGVLRLVLTVCW